MEDRSYAVVAVLFLSALLLGAGLIVWWMQSGPAELQYYDIVSDYDVSGLQIQAPVKFKGVRVGSVKKVELDPKDPEKVRIRIAVIDQTPVNQSTYAEISSTGVTGVTIVALHNKSSQAPPLETSSKHPTILPMQKGLMQEIESRGRALLSQSQQVAHHLNALLDQSNRQKVAQILMHLDRGTKQLVSAEKALLPALRRVGPLTQSLQQTLSQAQALLVTVRTDAKALHRLTHSSNAVANTLSDRTLPQFDRLARHLEETIEQIDALTGELRRNPNSLLYGEHRRPGPGEPGYELGTKHKH